MKKYKVTPEFMDALNEWNKSHKYADGAMLINNQTLNELTEDVTEWIFEIKGNIAEGNRRFGAIINFINGEDVFDIGTPSYIVRLKDDVKLYGKGYIRIATNGCVNITYYMSDATKFDDFNKASEWANKHFEVVELDG